MKTNPKSVLVVGSGIAGLTVAQKLHEHGWDVIVLEARNRIGGAFTPSKALISERIGSTEPKVIR